MPSEPQGRVEVPETLKTELTTGLIFLDASAKELVWIDGTDHGEQCSYWHYQGLSDDAFSPPPETRSA